jgi:hypothetical protein
MAGTPGSLTVTALDQNGQLATGYTGTVHFTSSDGQATLPADYTFTAADRGQHTFTNGVTLTTAGSPSLTVTDSSDPRLTATQSGIVVMPAAATTLLVTDYPSPILLMVSIIEYAPCVGFSAPDANQKKASSRLVASTSFARCGHIDEWH